MRMSSGSKSELADEMWKLSGRDKVPIPIFAEYNTASSQHIIDGASLIHKISWSKKNMVWSQLLFMYSQYGSHVYG